MKHWPNLSRQSSKTDTHLTSLSHIHPKPNPLTVLLLNFGCPHMVFYPLYSSFSFTAYSIHSPFFFKISLFRLHPFILILLVVYNRLSTSFGIFLWIIEVSTKLFVDSTSCLLSCVSLILFKCTHCSATKCLISLQPVAAILHVSLIKLNSQKFCIV